MQCEDNEGVSMTQWNCYFKKYSLKSSFPTYLSLNMIQCSWHKRQLSQCPNSLIFSIQIKLFFPWANSSTLFQWYLPLSFLCYNSVMVCLWKYYATAIWFQTCWSSFNVFAHFYLEYRKMPCRHLVPFKHFLSEILSLSIFISISIHWQFYICICSFKKHRPFLYI